MLRRDTPATLRCGDQLLNLSSPLVMGILNATPDSFYPESRVPLDTVKIAEYAGKMVNEGASIIDIGGMSTRPGAEEIDLQLELDRVLPVIEVVRKLYPHIIISLDTYRSKVALEGIRAGVGMINDISGGHLDEDMIPSMAKAQVAYVLMHMRGQPSNMQTMTEYKDLIGEVMKYFVEKIRVLHQAGIQDIVIDPGFGFSKTMQHNYELINRLHVFNMLGHPLMIGLSRKSTLAKTIGRPIEDTLQATSALHLAALQGGAKILRVHDVQAAKDVIAVYQQLQSRQENK
jgi:dihydropteroate synthase